jgi:colicin import membrane protein
MVLDRPRKPARVSGRWPALALAIAVHVVFIAVLVFSLRWQNRKPEPVTAELYAPPAKTATAEPVEAKPAPEPPPPAREPPPPAPAPPEPAPPPKPAPKPEPKVESPPDIRAADIARKAKEEEERKKREQAQREKAEREKRDAEQREAEKKKQAEQRRVAEARERQQREADALKAQAEREQATRAAQQADAAAAARAAADYIRRIQAKIKGNVVLPPDLSGNPEAIFEVVQLPTGEIIDAVLRKSSGVRAYDDAVQRAIIKSSPLPRPDRPDLFQRTLTLKFRPLD